MKALLIIGAILFALGIIFGAVVGSQEKYGTELSDRGTKIVNGSILTGFALIIISGIMYLKK